MPQARDEAGNIWNVDERGNVIGLAQPAPRTGQVFTLPQNPKEARAEDRAEAAAERQTRADERAAAKADREAREWAATHNPDGSPKAKADGKPNQNAMKRAQVEALTKQMLEVDRQLRTNFEGEGDWGWREYLPTPTNRAFDAAAAGLSEQALGAFRVPGVGSQSDADLRAFNEANKLTSSNFDEVNRERFNTVRNRVDEVRKALGMDPVDWAGATQRADNEAPNQDNGAPLKAGTTLVDPGALPPANGTGGGNPPVTPWDQPNPSGGTTVATGSMRTIHSDRLSAQVDAMMNAGASKAMIDTVLKQQGFPPIDPSTYAAAKKWMQENPDQKYFGASIDRQEPNSLLAQVAGSAPGSFVAQMADAATAGTVGALAGDKGRGALDAMDQINPDASLAGSILGGIAGAGAAETTLMARAPAALAQYAPRIADALYGGLSGFNGADDGEGAQGAAIGAGLGALGGAVGDTAMRTAGRLTRGVTSPMVQELRARGVPMTVGQAVGQSGWLGGAVKKAEDALTSIPGVGNIIDARRREGIEGFNRAAFEVGSETTGGSVQDFGAAGLNQLRDAVGRTYDNALGPARIDATDPAFVADFGAARAAAARIPDVNGAQAAALAGLDARVTGAIDPNTNVLTGRGFQEAYRGLARTGRERANSDYGYEVGQVMRQGQDALVGALERQNPGAYQGFVNANQGNRRLNVLADAVGRAKNQEDNLFTPAQLNMADATAATRLTGRVNSAAGDRPFADLAQAGQAVLPSRLPDSGTATRAAVGLAATGALGGTGYAAGGTEGAGTGAGLGLGATLALMAGGTRASQRAAERLLLDRPELAVRLGNRLIDESRIGGWTGAGALAPLFVGP